MLKSSKIDYKIRRTLLANFFKCKGCYVSPIRECFTNSSPLLKIRTIIKDDYYCITKKKRRMDEQQSRNARRTKTKSVHQLAKTMFKKGE